jgi:hypothetical protein
MVNFMLSLLSHISINAANALATTVGFSSFSIRFSLSIKSERSTRYLSWSYSFATQKADVFLT